MYCFYLSDHIKRTWESVSSFTFRKKPSDRNHVAHIRSKNATTSFYMSCRFPMDRDICLAHPLTHRSREGLRRCGNDDAKIQNKNEMAKSFSEFPAELEVESLADGAGGGGIAGANKVLAWMGGESVFEAEIKIVQDIEAHHR